MSTSCPHSAHGRRKTARPGEPLAPDVEVVDGIWHLRSHDLVKQVLRAGRTTQQAGFNSDMARAHTTAMKDPILFMDGDEHRRQPLQLLEAGRDRALVADQDRAIVRDELGEEAEAELKELEIEEAVELGADPAVSAESTTDETPGGAP